MRTTLLCVALLSTGCLARSLRTPAEDHHVQTATIAARCNAGFYGPCTPELREDLEDMAHGACLIDAIAKGDDGSACKREAKSK